MIEIGKDIDYAVNKLKDGGIVGIPTETVYGLGCNALNESSVKKIFKLKSRPKNDPIICHTNSVEKIRKYVDHFPKNAEILARKFWPGPLTILLRKNKLIPDIITSKSEYVGFRIPNNKITLSVLGKLDFPLAAPSANKFEYISPTNPQHIIQNFNDGIDYILDDGNCLIGIESTILGFEKEKTVIFRLGGITLEDIEKSIGKCYINKDKVKIPGSFKKHYSPNKKVYIGDIKKLSKKFEKKKIGILSFNKKYKFVDEKYQIVMSEKSSLYEASQNFYSSLYILDNLEIDLIIASYLPNNNIGRSINDRLKKCSENG